MKMPEFLIFVKWITAGLIGAEVFRLAYYLGQYSWLTSPTLTLFESSLLFIFGIIASLIYLFKRGAFAIALRMIRSLRIDLLIAVGIGIKINILVSQSTPHWLEHIHTLLKTADSDWATVVLTLLFFTILVPLCQHYWPRPEKDPAQLYFMADEEIKHDDEDILASHKQAESFANTVLASEAHQGLIFGIDGPWGVGKTSFINLAEHHWKKAEDKVIVCRFEPLRYTPGPELVEKLIRDLTAAIQSQVFAPEFRPAASRYSRFIKGKADLSFFGFQLSLEPSQETVDDLLDDIDEVLRRIGRRVIIVIDDLDRLDAETINSVLFATKQTFKLSQATYILCYDTEILYANKDEGEKARQFLEKFVTVKLSLFVDSSRIRDFLRRDWQQSENQVGSIPSETMFKLGSVLSELADILDDNELAAKYLCLVGDMRKLKRFVNAMLLMQIEKSDLGRTDFNKRDLINLMLLNLYHPGLFRRIYAEETEGRSGSFSVRKEYGKSEFNNSSELLEILSKQPDTAEFLLKQLFDVEILELNDFSSLDEEVRRQRACFNQNDTRNLEAYLKLIVRFVTPEPQQTYVLYQKAVEKVSNGASIVSILKSTDFQTESKEHAHTQFWNLLVNKSHYFSDDVADDAINTLVEYLPYYSMIGDDFLAPRRNLVYCLLRLLNQAGWPRSSGRRVDNSSGNVVQIAWRIFGEHSYQSKGLLRRMVSEDRGVLGWYDLMLFRLSCCHDRQGQQYNVYSALIYHHDMEAKTSGVVSDLTLKEMRDLSQAIFAMFKQTYIDQNRNFIADVNSTPEQEFFGIENMQANKAGLNDGDELEPGELTLDQKVSAQRSTVKTFVVYQLSNTIPPKGSGVGCGYYDEDGDEDKGGISKQMNEYMFGVCFNPDLDENNTLLFLDFCLSHLSNGFFNNMEEDGYVASKNEISGGLDLEAMGHYWMRHGDHIRKIAAQHLDRQVVTSNYTAFYADDLDGVFSVLDKLTKDIG